jgi:hypothetical protein
MLKVLLVASAVILAQELPPACSPSDQECTLDNPALESDSELPALEVVPILVTSPPPPIKPLVGRTNTH